MDTTHGVSEDFTTRLLYNEKIKSSHRSPGPSLKSGCRNTYAGFRLWSMGGSDDSVVIFVDTTFEGEPAMQRSGKIYQDTCSEWQGCIFVLLGAVRGVEIP